MVARRLGRLREERGGVLVETAIVLPFLIAIVLGGLVLGYTVYARVALAWTVSQAARELGSAGFQAELGPGQAYKWDGFSETYGLSRGHVRTVLLREDVAGEDAIYVAACFRVPMAMPSFAAKNYDPNAEDLPDFYEQEVVWDFFGLFKIERTVQIPYPEQVIKYRDSAVKVRNQAQKTVEQAKDAWARGQDLVGQVQELLTGNRDAVLESVGTATGETLEAKAQALCKQEMARFGGGFIVTAKAAAYGE